MGVVAGHIERGLLEAKEGPRGNVLAMGVPGIVPGERLGPFPGRLSSDLIRRYGEATKDPNPRSRSGEAAPAVAVATQIWDAQRTGFHALVPQGVRASMTGGVHGEHDVMLHRPVVPGEPLRTWVEGYGSRRAAKHNLVTLRYATYGRDGGVVAEQWWTTVLLDALGEPAGEAPPAHSFPEEARVRPIGDYGITVDKEMPRRYAEASGDWSEHHFDDEVARREGFRGRFLHGLCSLGLCAQGIVALVGDGDPEKVQRIAVRFASPTYVGDDLVVHLYEAKGNAYAFEAEAGGAVVIRNGIAELRQRTP